ncbi:hypothetical protein M5K25_015410 [Dendrobium thyrsiflorum]|uniref:H(+)-transporting two-sector ATPase n=1 Tax=Dendrobium thyrsiflorum TaxID=117978 RepID=A0ABD0UY31_DENTH
MGYQPILSREIGSLQEIIPSTKEGSITTIQIVYIPANDLTCPAPTITLAHLFATTIPWIQRQLCYNLGLLAMNIMKPHKGLSKLDNDIIVILGLDELSEEDLEVFTNSPEKYVGLTDTIRRFQFIFSRELNGNIDEAIAKAMNLNEERKLNK